jgi:hypothetical protein
MRNAKTKQVSDYWLDLRGNKNVPARADINPKALRQVLPFIFLADIMSPDVTAFRLAGTGLCERYGRELRDHNLQTMWRPADRVAIRGLIVNAVKQTTPGLATFRAETIDRRSVACEMLLLPLLDQKNNITKLLGCTFATESTTHLGNRALVYQRLETTKLILSDGTYDADVTAPDQTQEAAIREKGHLRLVVSQDLPDDDAVALVPESVSNR